MRRTLAGEREQQAAIITYLQFRGWYVIRLNNQPIFDPRYQQFWRPNKHTPKGMADLLALKPARRATFVEVKVSEVDSQRNSKSSEKRSSMREQITSSHVRSTTCRDWLENATVRNRQMN
jgi:hypothetical protein